MTLLTAGSVAALVLAGAAQAGTITGSVNGVAATGAANGQYTIAAERTDASIATPAGGFVVTNTLTTPLSITQGTTQNYRVTFTVTNGTIAGATLAVTGTGPAATVAAAGSTSTSATFIVTVDAVGAPGTITAFALTSTLTSPTETSVAVAATTELLAGGVATSVDNTAATTLVRYAPVIGAFTATSNNTLAALPNFQSFTNTGVTTNPAPLSNGNLTAQLATGYGVAQNAGTFYAGLASNAVVTRDAIINGGTLTITGAQLNVLTPALTSGGTLVTSATNAVFTLTDGQADALSAGANFTLTQAGTPVAIQAGSFTSAFLPTYVAGYTAPTTATSVASGNIALDGVNFIAPWISGSQAAGQSVIRLSNGAAAPSGTVTLRLSNARARAAGVTTGAGAPIANQTCSTAFTIPATGELQIGASELSACFGAFLRGDVQITVQSAASQLTAKARTISDGVTTETSLGRFSGAQAADASF
ncbi:hypothetical protein [Brevundimonas variabilis]|uniref:Uncharacterized protein n=1 Tax=Brevundimonas variabilis TaxID=74312 RepID=A0A7W9CHI2_9CAUL|nr:hypothetical protein [Brevundimonas variabilis]MBB5745322.1 hypothetical protein [Brevundimonas variabilis]